MNTFQRLESIVLGKSETKVLKSLSSTVHSGSCRESRLFHEKEAFIHSKPGHEFFEIDAYILVLSDIIY
jgi:hypothetical protein